MKNNESLGNFISNNEIVSIEEIQKRIFTLRGTQVMLDEDLAKLYGVETKRLNEQVKRNIERFPESFMFQLTINEMNTLRSQFATSSWGKSLQWKLYFDFNF